MIHIKRTKAFWSDLETLHLKELDKAPYNVSSTLNGIITDAFIAKETNQENLFKHLKKHLPNILIGAPSVLEGIISTTEPLIKLCDDELKKKFPKADDYKPALVKFKSNIEKVFNYVKFRSEYKKYGAYSLVNKLNVSTCPYCNRLHTTTIETNEGRTRAKLDHWFDRATHLYLAISLYNLIPCCSICNSDLKGSEKFNLKNNIHPYLEGFEDQLYFKSNISSAAYKTGGTDSFSLDFYTKVSGSSETDLMGRARESIRVFCLKDLYNHHKEIAGKVIEKIDSASPDYLDSLLLYKNHLDIPLFRSKNDVLKRYFDIIIDRDLFETEIFSKLKRDIALEQKLFPYP